MPEPLPVPAPLDALPPDTGVYPVEALPLVGLSPDVDTKIFGAKAAEAAARAARAGVIESQARANHEFFSQEHAPAVGAAALNLFSGFRGYNGPAIEVATINKNIATVNQARREQADREVQENLKAARTTFVRYDQNQVKIVEDYFKTRQEAADIPEQFDAWRQAAKADTWTDFVAAKATDAQLVEVMQWHANRMKNLNESPEMKRRLVRLGDSFYYGVDRLVDNGIVDDTLLDRAQEKLSTVKVEISDVFDLETQGYLGYAYTGKDRIVLGEDLDPHVFFHEMFHTLITDEAVHSGWTGESLLRAIIDESIVDTLALNAANRANVRTPIHPDKHTNKKSHYRNSKRLTAYQLGTGFKGFTEAEFIKDYTGKKRLLGRLLTDRFAKQNQFELKTQAAHLQKIGATKDSLDFDLAAGAVYDSEIERDLRYQRGREAASGVQAKF